VFQLRLESLSSQGREDLDRVRELEEGITRRRAELDAEAEALQKLAGEVHALERAVQRDDQDLAYWRKDRCRRRATTSSWTCGASSWTRWMGPGWCG
jgi:chromosome segregation protein